MFVDSHAHLEGKQFQADREQVIARAREAGIEHIVAIGNGDGPGSLDCGIKLAEQYDFLDRKSTRLNSSHRCISYAVFCLKKKKAPDDRTSERLRNSILLNMSLVSATLTTSWSL